MSQTALIRAVAGNGPTVALRHRPRFRDFRRCYNKSIRRYELLPPTDLVIVVEAVNKLYRTETSADVGNYISLLSACARLKLLQEGKRVHNHISRNPVRAKNPDILEMLTCFYVSCGNMIVAQEVFDEIPEPGVFLWNSMIRAYAWNGPHYLALDLYFRMRNTGVVPNKFTYPFVLKACSTLKLLDEGVEIHGHAERAGLDTDVFISTALIDMYMKCGRLGESRSVFRKMPLKDIVAWNSMVAGHSLHGLYDDAVGFVLEMQKMGLVPNASTLVSILPVIGREKFLSQVKSVHGFCIRRDMHNDVLVGTAALDAYGKCERADHAQKIFDAMAVKNEITWSAMIGSFIMCDRLVEALHGFNRIVSEGSWNLTSTTLACVLRACAKLTDLHRGRIIHSYMTKIGFVPDTTVGNTLLSMYAKCGAIDDAMRFFSKMESKDTVSYSAIISGCVQNGNAKEALVVFQKMHLTNVEPDIATMAGIVPACSHLAALLHGKCCHSFITIYGFAYDTSLCNALIDMYGKCGRIDYARKVFDRMIVRDLVSWNSLIMSYGIHGLGNEAVLLFTSMQETGLEPDDVSFICLLSACSHSGLVSEGKRWFRAMTQKFNISPRREHHVCIVDLLGRAGLLDEAQEFIKQELLEQDIHVWGALLGACRIHKNIELAEVVSIKIQMLGPQGTGNFVLLSNIYSAAGRFEEAANVRTMQKKMGLKKSPGCSWVEVRGVVHAFIGGDQAHPQLRQISEFLRDLIVEMKKLGYNADTSFALHNVEEEEKEHALLYHSEKLAVAFGIINLGADQTILVTKNLRICGDCHSAIKYITMVTKREISVRDASRFHHFKNGICNCGDFW